MLDIGKPCRRPICLRRRTVPLITCQRFQLSKLGYMGRLVRLRYTEDCYRLRYTEDCYVGPGRPRMNFTFSLPIQWEILP